MSTVTNRTAITMPNPKAPLSKVVKSIDHGTVMSAFVTSSAIFRRCQEGMSWFWKDYLHEPRHHILCSH